MRMMRKKWRMNGMNLKRMTEIGFSYLDQKFDLQQEKTNRNNITFLGAG